MNRQTCYILGEIFAKLISDKELIFRIYKEVLKFNINTKNPLIKRENI